MSQNLISAEFTAEEQQSALAAIQQLQSLPFLIGLSNKDKRTLNKMGNKSRSFVDQALDVAKQNTDILPNRFDLEEFERDVNLYNALHPINTALSKLSELVDGTLLAVGSDAYTAALDVYAYAKMSNGVTGLEDLRAAMGSRFRNNSGRKPAEISDEMVAPAEA
ncbi:MAG: hypothetical protein KZQ73_03315 [Candidatus Thiodiazotropha sp. (ex Semelilucina semeliformis)]|nr:hypothetical protein [Candidatus Thiodiazotropha sp. (ex Semelilucina semeliformis)]